MRTSCALAIIALLLVAPASQAASGAIRLDLDASHADDNLFHGTLEVPVTPGPLTLVYPRWIPGEHGPTGPITDFVGLKFTAAGATVAWSRDPEDMYAFHVDVPRGASTLEVAFDFLGATSAEGFTSAASATPSLAVIAWNQFLLYPQGARSDDVTFVASLTMPADWTCATSLDVASRSGDRVEFKPVSLTMLVDSPAQIGRYTRVVPLDTGPRPIELDIAADSPTDLDISPETVDKMKALVREADALFGARHFDHYHFLLTLSDHVAHFGLEHHQSNDTRLAERTLLDDKLGQWGLWVLSHEFVHSWNAKYRRPAGLATPNYQEPMQGNMLWVYEGLTEYLGCMLAARSGLWSPEYYRERLAEVAAYYDHVGGRAWRPLEDTCVAAQLLYPAPHAWAMTRRGTDFYDEGWLLWLDVDTQIREITKGKRSLDDFCRLFHGGESGPPKVVPYTFDDVVDGLNSVAANDWRAFLTDRVDKVTAHPPMGGIEHGGWHLVYNNEKSIYLDALKKQKKVIEAAYSIGLRVHEDGSIEDIAPDSPASRSDIGPGMSVVAVNGRKFSPDVLHDALKASAGTKQPLDLLIENHAFFTEHPLDYHDGLRIPHLERDGKTPDVLDQIIAPKAKTTGKGK